MLYMIVNTHNAESCAFRSKPDAVATSGAFDRFEELELLARRQGLPQRRVARLQLPEADEEPELVDHGVFSFRGSAAGKPGAGGWAIRSSVVQRPCHPGCAVASTEIRAATPWDLGLAWAGGRIGEPRRRGA